MAFNELRDFRKIDKNQITKTKRSRKKTLTKPAMLVSHSLRRASHRLISHVSIGHVQPLQCQMLIFASCYVTERKRFANTCWIHVVSKRRRAIRRLMRCLNVRLTFANSRRLRNRLCRLEEKSQKQRETDGKSRFIEFPVSGIIHRTV